MDRKDWDPDDLLDFNYKNPVHRESAAENQNQRSESFEIQSSKKADRGPEQYGNWDQKSADRANDLFASLNQTGRERSPEKPASRKSPKPAAKKPDAGSRKPAEIGTNRNAVKDSSIKKAAGGLLKRNNKKQVLEDQTAKQPVYSSVYEEYAAARRAPDEYGAAHRSPEEAEALRMAQQEAYDRYRSNYDRNYRKMNKPRKAGFLTKFLSVIYILAAVAFVFAIIVVDVLPFGYFLAFVAILALLSLIIVIQLRKNNIRRWVRVLASVTALALIACFGVGTAYAMGTLSFLEFTSVENANKVHSVVREPFNVCITGIDVRGKIDTEGRSDVNMIVTVNPKTEQILMTSIPRDYQIYMPDKDYAMDKLTHTGFYSVDTTIGAEENLLDTKINYYVKVNFSTVIKFIDAIGGIDVYSEYEFTPVKMKKWTVQKGMNHMNGKQALAFARERKAFVDGDNQRIKNQQAVFEALIKKATGSTAMLISYNKVITSLKDYFRMSFSSGEFRSLIKLQLGKNPDWKIYKNTLVGDNGLLPTYSTGSAAAYVMLQDETSVNNARTLIRTVLEGGRLEKDKDGTVTVSEGSGD